MYCPLKCGFEWSLHLPCIKENILRPWCGLLLVPVGLYNTYCGLQMCYFYLWGSLRILHMCLMNNQQLQSDFRSLELPHTFRIQLNTEHVIKGGRGLSVICCLVWLSPSQRCSLTRSFEKPKFRYLYFSIRSTHCDFSVSLLFQQSVLETNDSYCCVQDLCLVRVTDGWQKNAGRLVQTAADWKDTKSWVSNRITADLCDSSLKACTD